MTRPSTPPAPPRRRGALPGGRTIAAVALPLLAVSVAILVWHTHGYHIDLEVYRLGVATGQQALLTFASGGGAPNSSFRFTLIRTK